MGEIKSVKVDNWGVFFLQKLQNFFNKTDYCDLTLQFRDNSQLKVHRLVLSACTDYFNVLEQTCEVVDDALIMPNELQADVVVPIVNFMYTGTLEFELKMYGKLLRTAKEMNMTVLLKLLEAHRRTMEGVNRSQRPASPKPIRRKNIMAGTSGPTGVTQTRIFPNAQQQQQQQPQARRILTTANAPQTIQRRLVQTKTVTTNAGITQSQLPMQFRQQIGSTSLIKTSPNKGQQRTIYETTYTPDETGIQFKQEQQDEYELPTLQQSSSVNQSTSPFEQLRKGYNNNKRPASATFISPPAKKPNIEDVKEFSEQQRMRKQIAAEYGDDNEYEGMLDDDIHNDDDDDDAGAAVPTSSTSGISIATTSRQQQQQQSGPSIIIKQEPNEKPTIVVKDSANSKMNHAKIISEVLRQYPHLVKSNKNIKLKIMPNVGGQNQKIIVKKEQIANITAELASNAAQSSVTSANVSTQSHAVASTKQSPQQKQQSLIDKSILLQQQQQTRSLLAPVQKISAASSATATAVDASNTTAPAAAAAAAINQKRRIDSKTMHALIAQGAENTTGPWLCLRCGINGRPISIPSYRGFRRHLINTHKETIDPALCEHCGYRSANNRELHFHTQVEHKVKTTLYTFPECSMCTEIFIDTNVLNQHMVDNHPDENQQQCIYCNKIFAKEMLLYTHMKTYHKKQAIDDGIIDYSDDEDGRVDADESMATQDEFIDEHVLVQKRALPTPDDKKIKILSDISLPSASSLMKLEPSSEAAALTTMASGIAASIALSETTEEFINSGAAETTALSGESNTVSEPKFVSADGNEMVLTDEQRKEIMSQLNQEHEGSVVMVLNEPTFPDTNTDANIEETTASHGEDAARVESEDNAENSANEEEYDDNNIYSEFVGGASGREAKKVGALDESKGSVDNLEWAENLISAQELEDETEGLKKKDVDNISNDAKSVNKDENINKKLQELTGDWTDDENEDEEVDDEEQKILQPSKEDEGSPLIASEIEPMDTSTDHTEIEKPDEEAAMEEDNSVTAEKSVTEAETDKENYEDVKDDIDIALKGLHKGDTDTSTDVIDNDKEKDNTNTEEVTEKNDEATEDDQNIDESSKKDLIDDNEKACEDVKKDEIETEPTVVSEKEVYAVEAEAEVEEKSETTVEKDVDKVDIIDINREMKKSLLDELIHQNDDDDEDVDDLKSNIEVEQKVDTEQSENQTDENSVKAPTAKDEAIDEDNSETATSTSETKESAIKEKSESVADAATSSTKSSEEKVKTLISEWGEDDEDDEL